MRRRALQGANYLIAFLFLIGCSAMHSGSDGSLTNNGLSSEGLTDIPGLGTVDLQESLGIFEATLYPLITQNCQGCHGASQVPRFAVSDSQVSHDTLINNGLVKLEDPASSRIVQKIAGVHNNFPVSLADDLLAAIESWADQLVAQNPGGTLPLPAPPALAATYSSIYALIIAPKCLACHNPNGIRPGQDFTDYQSLLASQTITPGDAQDSDFYTECEDGEMPQNAPMLSNLELEAIANWIDDGAMEN